MEPPSRSAKLPQLVDGQAEIERSYGSKDLLDQEFESDDSSEDGWAGLGSFLKNRRIQHLGLQGSSCTLQLPVPEHCLCLTQKPQNPMKASYVSCTPTFGVLDHTDRPSGFQPEILVKKGSER